MILVTGATGNIGGEVLRQLAAGGEAVRVLSRDPAKLGERAGVEIVRADLTKAETLDSAFRGVEKAFLVAGAIDIPEVARLACAAAKKAGVRHIVLVSSSTIELDPPVAIGRWHLAAEEHLRASGIPWTMLRPGNFAANALRWAGPIRSQGAVFATPSDGRSAPIDPLDIASVAVKALTSPGHEGRTYVLTGPLLLSLAEQVQCIGAVLGKPLRVVDVPEAGARAGMLKSGMPEVIVDALLELMRAVQARGDERLSPDVRDVTGRDPRPFDAWVRDHLAAFA